MEVPPPSQISNRELAVEVKQQKAFSCCSFKMCAFDSHTYGGYGLFQVDSQAQVPQLSNTALLQWAISALGFLIILRLSRSSTQALPPALSSNSVIGIRPAQWSGNSPCLILLPLSLSFKGVSPINLLHFYVSENLNLQTPPGNPEHLLQRHPSKEERVTFLLAEEFCYYQLFTVQCSQSLGET